MLKYHTWKLAKPVVITIIGVYVSSTIGAVVYAQTATPEVMLKEVEKVVLDNSVPPILEKIMKCESGGKHYDKNGQVLINRTQDIGIMQINVPIWGKKAHEMGLNLSVEADNIEFGMWLYKNKGTEPWVHSKPCWNK